MVGNGTMTIRRHGRSVVHPAGSVLSFDALLASDVAAGPPGLIPAPRTAPDAVATSGRAAATSLRAAADGIGDRFDAALVDRDVDRCVEEILALEQALLDWSTDTLSSDHGDQARARLREMVVRLGELAAIGARDPRDVVGPFVEALLELRAKARAGKDFATSDRVRDALLAAHVEVRDTPDGVVWLVPPTD